MIILEKENLLKKEICYFFLLCITFFTTLILLFIVRNSVSANGNWIDTLPIEGKEKIVNLPLNHGRFYLNGNTDDIYIEIFSDNEENRMVGKGNRDRWFELYKQAHDSLYAHTEPHEDDWEFKIDKMIYEQMVVPMLEEKVFVIMDSSIKNSDRTELQNRYQLCTYFSYPFSFEQKPYSEQNPIIEGPVYINENTIETVIGKFIYDIPR